MGAVGNWEEEWSRSTWLAEEEMYMDMGGREAEEVVCGEGTRKRKRAEESTISFKQQEEEGDAEAIQQMKEIMYRAAAMRPVHHLAAESRLRRRRRNVRISTDPQTVAARQRRERISERLRLLQKLVPGGSKMDTATMLDEAANYLKFLRSQVTALQTMPPPHIADFFTFANPPNPTT